MPIGITDEHLALHAAAKGWVERHCPPSVPRAQLDAEAEALPEFWPDLVAQGWTGLHLEETFGGEGYGIPELAVVLEELGAAAVPGPFLATTLAGAVLQAAGKEVAADVRPRPRRRLADRSGRDRGRRSRESRSTTARCGSAGRCDRSSRATSRTSLIVRRGRHLGGADRRRVRRARARQRGPDPTGRRGDGRRRGRPGEPPADRDLDATVRDLAAVLFAADAVGGSQWCVQTASEYAKDRRQFGRPIGQFQGVKHRCANMVGRTELARAATWDAARAVGDAETEGFAAAAAASLAIDGYFQTAKDCVQTLGGIGFTWEHDAHVYLRRAMATRALLGSASQ